MTLKMGDNLVSGQKVGFQFLNRIKNAFRIAAPLQGGVTNALPGMVLSDMNDNRRWHVVEVGGSTQAFEILQADLVVCINNQIVCLNNEVVTMVRT